MKVWVFILVPLVGLAAGFAGAFYFGLEIKSQYAGYFALAILAGLDSLFGGIRSAMEGRFRGDIFITGFVFNGLMAALLAYLGYRIGVDLFLAVSVVFGWRILLNVSRVRRAILESGPNEGNE